MRLSTIERQIAEVSSNPATSYWLKNALRTALQRDPMDAADDAVFMASLLGDRADAVGRGPS